MTFSSFCVNKVLLVDVAICCCIIICNSFITLSLGYGIWLCPADLGKRVIRQNSDISAAAIITQNNILNLNTCFT